MLQDNRDLNDWCAEFRVDLEASRAAGTPVMNLERLDEAG
jgi:hypothetical protein